jgi:hypothetical protein
MPIPHDALQIRMRQRMTHCPSRSPAFALPAMHLTVRKSRRVPPSGPVAQARALTGQGPQGAGHGWPAIFARQDVASKIPGRSPTRPEGQLSKRPLWGGPSLAGRRSRGPEGGTRRLLPYSANARPKASPPIGARRAKASPLKRLLQRERERESDAKKKRPPMGYRRPIWGDSLCPGVEPSPARALIIGIRV